MKYLVAPGLGVHHLVQLCPHHSSPVKLPHLYLLTSHVGWMIRSLVPQQDTRQDDQLHKKRAAD